MARLPRGFFAAAWLACAVCAPAHAQPRVQGPALTALPLQGTTQNVLQPGTNTVHRLSNTRLLANARLLRDNYRVLDEDAVGNPIVRGEVLGMNIAETALLHAIAADFSIRSEQRLEALDLRLVALQAPAGMSAKRALALLKTADPAGLYDYNHLFSGSGQTLSAAASAGSVGEPVVAHPASSAIRVGLVDTAVDSNHPAFKSSSIESWGCDGRFVPAAHGTAVASLLVGAANGFQGVLPGAALYAADVFCGSPTGGSTDALTAAFGWLLQQQVSVINVSLVGPRNTLLERVVAALVARGVVIVAAVGNDGPAAPPLYPASYPGVVGVTGVDVHRRVLLEAAQGSQVMFAAPGADLAAAAPGDVYCAVRGTSFAAPIVAGMLAHALSDSQLGWPEGNAAALATLAHAAIDLGSPGRDVTYGFGLVGTEFRTEPATLVQ